MNVESTTLLVGDKVTQRASFINFENTEFLDIQKRVLRLLQ
jgi:hypothetical protein